MRRWQSGIVGLVVLAAVAPAGVQWVDSMPLNSTAWTDGDYHDYYPQLTHDGAGNWVCVWCGSLTGSGVRDFEIYVTRSSDDGLTWSEAALLDPFASDPNETEDDFRPFVFQEGGDWLTAWYTYDNHNGTLGDDTDLLFSRSGDFGATWSSSLPLNTDAATDEIATGYASDASPVIAIDPNTGVWAAIWSRRLDSEGESDLYITHSTDQGATWTAPAVLHADMLSDDGSDFSPRIGTDGAGHWIAVWVSWATLGGTVGTDDDVFYSTSSDGYTWSAPAPLNSDADSDGDTDHTAPDLVYDGSGRWIAAWHQGIYDVVDDDVYYAYTDDHGASWTDPNYLNTNALTDSERDRQVALGCDGHGRWIAMWYSANTLGLPIGIDDDIQFAVSEDNGTTWSDPSVLNSYAAELFDWEYDWNPEIKATTAGRWVAAWHSRFSVDGAGTDWDIIWSTVCLPTTPGDVQCDGAADLTDVMDMQLNYAADPGDPWYAPYDLDGDDVLSIADVDLLSANLTGPQ